MRTIATALAVTLAASWMIAGSATSASAHSGRPGCNCGPKAPSTFYKTVHPAKFVTRYHDVSVFRHVHQIHQVVNVTRVQPIFHIHDVTRVHHHTIVLTSNAYQHVTQQLPPIYDVQRSIVNSYDCSCGH